MAEVNNAAIIGPRTVRPSGFSEDEQLWKLQQYDHALGDAGHAGMHYLPASFYVWFHAAFTPANDSTVNSLSVKAPWPLTIWAADVGCESAAGSAATVDIRVGSGSVLNAAEDVKTTAGTAARVAPEDGSEDVAYNSAVFIRVIGTGAGAVVGAQAHLYCQRL